MFNKVKRVAAVVALLGLAWTASAARAADTKFQAGATFQVDFGASHGMHLVATGEGTATPGGPFDMTVSAKDNNGNYHETAEMTMDFGNGNTLTVYIEDDLNLDVWNTSGTYERDGTYLITGGTGKFAGASGSGIFTGYPAGDGTGTIYLDGTISR